MTLGSKPNKTIVLIPW